MFLGTRSIRTGFVISLLCCSFFSFGIFSFFWETGFMVPFVQLEVVKKFSPEKFKDRYAQQRLIQNTMLCNARRL